jgi:acyl transferase domain-containing protein
MFRRTLDVTARYAGAVLGRSLLDWCYGAGATTEDLAHTAVAQPLLFGFEVALARLVMSWGLHPDAVVGHSVGELAAACVAGVLSLEDGMTLARERGRLMEALPESGMMAAVFAPEAVVRAAIAHDPDVLAIAAINGPDQVVIGGRTSAVEQVMESLARAGFSASRLNVSHAFHSPLMTPMLKPFADVLRSLIKVVASTFSTGAIMFGVRCFSPLPSST